MTPYHPCIVCFAADILALTPIKLKRLAVIMQQHWLAQCQMSGYTVTTA
uniref:Uncharacterized protein n=1 Tax=Rheinheimera sp. BAL341 TaxID=1708203 RepID=A0A486XTF9_9GAMM